MKKKVLLFSGGFDSTLLEWVVKPDILLYVNMHTAYSDKEVCHLENLSSYYRDRLIVKDLPLGEYEQPDSFLPYRNLMLICIALQYGPNVYMGLSGQDIHMDCSKEFIAKARKMFSLLNKDCAVRLGWNASDFSLEAPFKGMTKTQMLKECLSSGMPSETAQLAHSCYSGYSEKGCGECLPCWNKAIALINNGIYREDLFDSPISFNMFKVSLDLYEKKFGNTKKDYLHYWDVVNAYKRLQEIRK